jgi:hypothetical protein
MDDAARVGYDEELAQDLARRLRRACAHLSAPEFDSLVADLVAMKARFRAIDRNPAFWCHARDHPATQPTDDGEWPLARPYGQRDD